MYRLIKTQKTKRGGTRDCWRACVRERSSTRSVLKAFLYKTTFRSNKVKLKAESRITSIRPRKPTGAKCFAVRNYDYRFKKTRYTRGPGHCRQRVRKGSIVLHNKSFPYRYRMNDKDDSAWVFDSLIGFLQGPIWSAPLITFIEEKSLIFEAGVEENDEYQKIYQEYKNLVDLLLGCFMEDMGITPEQFEYACTVNKYTKMPIQFQQNLFEQIWAANEYEIFKRMMIQKNLELQLQALNMIEQKYGLTPASLMYETDGLHDDTLVMEEIIQKHALSDDPEEEQDISSETSLIKEHERLAAKYHNERALLEEALKASQEKTPETESLSSPAEEEDEEEEEETGNASKIKRTIPLDPTPSDESKSDEPNVSEEDIKKRQAYLKARRDKLVALKKEARSQRLEMNSTRPCSARTVAEATIKGEQELKLPEPLEPSILQVRKALAARLQAEVVRKQTN
ncbi:cilia- and flagella-associated protein 36 [Colletes gigas]|uniref:cilia- and flagella-associated protein 36 n=1 Tax=Colletes gigas TaxID=935657 RepID=UPI001C9BA83C|nr:cilia- and flagella-associated protein 36 [Colletes gigas]